MSLFQKSVLNSLKQHIISNIEFTKIVESKECNESMSMSNAGTNYISNDDSFFEVL